MRMTIHIVVLSFLLVSVAPLGAAERPARAEPVRVGFMGSIFRDMPEPVRKSARGIFGTLIESETGLRGELSTAAGAEELAGQMASGKVEFGVFHGFEFAYAHARQNQLRPLMIAVSGTRNLQAVLVVRKDCPASSLADLKGKTLTMPQGNREHCRLYLERECGTLGAAPKEHFNRITASADVEEALDEVVDGNVQATVVDASAIDFYRRWNPGRATRLKELQKSILFPPAVIAYHPEKVDDATLRQFRGGLLHACQSTRGKQLLMLWRLTAFEPVPHDFEQRLQEVVKKYPPQAE